ncbi:MAG: Flp family type IVb pilin [Sphingomonadales bacterium]|jgi:pilus assembly protein Flp/PilA
MTLVRRFIRDEEGATAIEYGLIAALVAIAAITALTSVGSQLTATFTEVATELDAANGP